jgi:hypothetical protein
MTYTPNFNDPRIQARVERALEFMEQFMRAGKQVPVSQSQINKYFGHSGRALSKWLKANLLECVDDYYNMMTGQCKRYRRNVEGYQRIKELMGIKQVEICLTPKEQEQLTTGDVEYVKRGNRSYHRIQCLPKIIRRNLINRYKMPYEYDIEVCALTLLLQYSRHLGLSKPTPLLDQIVLDRSQVRQQLSQQLALSTDKIKSIMAKILNGGRVSTWHTSKIFEEVDYNPLMIQAIKQNPMIQQYQQEVRDVWSAIRPSLQLSPGERIDKKKTSVYNQLEEQVTDQIKKYLKKHKIKSFFVHDGWSCDKVVDVSELVRYVRTTTGFDIKLEWTIYRDDMSDLCETYV